MYRYVKGLPIALVVVALIAGCSSSEPTSPPVDTSLEIKGSVTRQRAEDVGNVEVWLDSSLSITIKPDATYSFANVAAGTHHVEVRAGFPIDMEPSMRSVVVGTSDVTNVDFVVALKASAMDTLITATTVPGTFQMGCDSSDLFADIYWATPKHTVTITKSLEVAIYETTQRQWMRVMKQNPSLVVGDDLPVTNLTYDSVIAFCNRMSVVHGYVPVYIGSGASVQISPTANGYRLPTEAEWEYVASAGSTTAFSGIPDTVVGRPIERIFDDVNEIAWWGNNLGGVNTGKPQPVGSRRQNAWGLYDVHGNVAEIVEGARTKYTKTPTTDPLVLPYKDGPGIRGGSYMEVQGAPWLITLRGRRTIRFNDAYPFVGFRVVRTR
ncbi:MAG: SUMF1/EgtB/PvdO family nonheme iron enzyme [Ignavibacteria bacterium]|nr:SUMF1/EgtB/PvdO family nonheme iron enzyme [Ignavibacteria bacterium]